MFRNYQYCKFMRFVVEKVKLLMKIGFDCIIKLHYYLKRAVYSKAKVSMIKFTFLNSSADNFTSHIRRVVP